MNLEKIQIGSLSVSPYGLAPMAGVTDYPFRKLCYEYKAPFCFTEMINSRAILENNKKTLEMLPNFDETRTVVQLFGNDPKTICMAAKKIEPRALWVDINSACPVKKVMKTGAGAALLRNPEKIYDIAKCLKDHLDKPVSFKFRKSMNLLEICQNLQEIGVDLIIVHGRTVDQGYTGKADWNFVYEIKKALSVPVFLSGDMWNVDSVISAFKMGVDGVLIARGARERPMIFEQVYQFISTGKLYEIEHKDIIIMMRRHFKMMLNFYGEERAVRKYKAFGIAFSKNLRNSKYFRDKLKSSESAEEVFTLLDELELSIKECLHQ